MTTLGPPDRDKIRDVDDRKLLAVECPEWGCTIWVAKHSAATATAVHRLSRTERDSGDLLSDGFFGKAAVLLSLKEDGSQVFEDSDYEWLAEEKSYVVLERIYQAYADHNGLGTRGDAGKNSETTPDDDSP